MIRKMLQLSLLAMFVMIAVSTIPGPTCSARSLDILQVEIEAAVQSDGSMRVIETRTVDFSGAFSGLEQALSHRGGISYSDVLVREGEELYQQVDRFPTSEPGTFALQQGNEALLVDWSYRAYNQTKSFTLEYTVHDAVVVHEDVAELGYFFVGDSWEIPSKRVNIVLTLPEGAKKEALRAWGHGPRRGVVTIAGPQLVTWQVSPLMAGESLSGRVTFPPNLVPRATRFSGKEALPEILREETAQARRANLVRTARALDPLYAVLVVVLAGLVLVLLWRQAANRAEAFRGKYYRELPGDYPPEVAGYLLSKKKMRGSFISAGILNMARRGFLKIERIRTEPGNESDYRLTGIEKDEPLNSADRRLHSFLFETLNANASVGDENGPAGEKDQVSVTLSRIRQFAKDDPKEFEKFYRSWSNAVKRMGEARNFFEDHHYRSWQIFTAILLGVLSFAAYNWGMYALFVTGFASTLALFFLAPKLWYTRYGADQKAKWEAFGRYLRDFSSIRDSSVSSLAIWEHYLVYAAAFGYAEQVVSGLAVALPGLAGGTAPGAGFFGMDTHGAAGDTALFDNFNMMNRSLAGTTGALHNRIVFSDTWSGVKSVFSSSDSSSSGSGSGGGFSGGGGGSFGGGGGSFR